MKTNISNKAEIIRTLHQCRSIYRGLVETKTDKAVIRRHVLTAIPFLTLIERIVPDDQLWTVIPDESSLTEDDTIGDHLSVTRRTLGLIA